MNPEFYSELEQIQEQKNQKRIEVCIYNMHIELIKILNFVNITINKKEHL